MARGFWAAGALLWAAAIFFASSLADLPGSWWLSLPFGDKVVHAGVFGLLGVLVYLATYRPRLSFLFSSLYGVSDEIHQAFVAGRTADVRDWLADSVGAILGIVLVVYLTRRHHRRDNPVQ